MKGAVVLAVALAALALAQFYAYDPGSSYVASVHGFWGVAVEAFQMGFGEFEHRYVEEVVGPGQYVRSVLYLVDPGMAASPWLPDGAAVEYTYTRATALFDAPADVDAKRDVKWYVYTIHHTDIWQRRPAGVKYGLQVAIKSDGRPVLDCLVHVKDVGKKKVFNATCPGNTSTVYIFDVYYFVTWPGERKLCVEARYFRQNVWWKQRDWRYGADFYHDCRPWEGPPRNVTVALAPAGGAARVDVYVDGERLYMPPMYWIEFEFGIIRGRVKVTEDLLASIEQEINITKKEAVEEPAPGLRWRDGAFYVNSSEARLFTGPYWLYDPATAVAYVRLNYPGIVLRPLGSAFLLIGNETAAAPPRYVLKQTWSMGYTQARVELTYDGGVSVSPGRTHGNSTVYVWPSVKVRIHGREAELLYRSLLNASALCPGGDVVVAGRYRRVGGWVEVLGPASVACSRYPVTFILPNGTAVEVEAEHNKTLVWTPPPVVYTNGTRLEADPVAVRVEGPAAVAVNYSRMYYRVRVVTPLGAEELWALRGSAAEAPAVIELGNGTRYVAAAGASAVVDRPLVLAPGYKRQYLVRLLAPVNATEAWADEGSVFVVGLADPWALDNGTLFARLLVNGTAARELRVDRPITLTAQYAEVYHWVEVDSPVNATRGWAPKGAVLRFPEAADFGNGTRLVGPNVREVVVERPLVLEVQYAKRQYYVKVEGVARWEGWADEGAVITPNATVADGVAYEPAEPVVANAPGVYRPLFVATYKTAVRDALGIPNPLAAVKLCNATARPQLDGSVVITAYTRELCQPAVEAAPVSPYTALAAVAAAAAAVTAVRRKKK